MLPHKVLPCPHRDQVIPCLRRDPLTLCLRLDLLTLRLRLGRCSGLESWNLFAQRVCRQDSPTLDLRLREVHHDSQLLYRPGSIWFELIA